MGELYLHDGKYEESQKLIEEALTTSEQIGDNDIAMECNALLGNLNLKMNRLEKSIKYSEKALMMAEQFHVIDTEVDAAETLARAYKKLGKYREALPYLETYYALKDSLINLENVRVLTAKDLRYKFDLEKKELELKQAHQASLLKAETQQTRTVAIAIGALALLGFGFFWNARRQNKVIATQNQQLEQINRTKDRIFSIIGHDLRKPAIAFRGITQKVNYLLKKKDYETLERLGNEIEKDALSLNQLTDNLLSWALTQKDVMPYNPKAIEVAPLVEEQLSIFEKIAAEKNIKLSAEIPNGLSVFADENALRAIIRNLVDNALKYTPEGGSVQIAAEESDQGIKIVVNDTGIGMPEEILHDIFLLKDGKSQQGTSGEKGTGLGLHLVHELVHLNKGEIKVASQLNKGTKFEILMPRQTQAA
ncbi:MAG: hypothetical protein D6816_15715 [Bacteroidetes bacterium]|nr:MAG: hypothetical protein D6816_15715 [Bacteroidota bacterium]